MTDAEYDKLAKAMDGALTGAEAKLSIFKSRGGRAEAFATKQYKEHKTDQPSWKLLATSLDNMTKLIAPTSKVILKIYAVGADKKARVNLSLAEAKKEIMDLMPKVRKMDDAAAEVLGTMRKVFKEVTQGDSTANVDLRAIQQAAMAFIEYFNDFKIKINSIK
jgi:hypothetical protein